MKSISRLFVLVLLFGVILSSQGFAQQDYTLFVWDNDNDLRDNDQVLGQSLTATQSVTRTLDNEDIEYDTDTELPDNINDYDVVVVCLSFYCPA